MVLFDPFVLIFLETKMKEKKLINAIFMFSYWG